MLDGLMSGGLGLIGTAYTAHAMSKEASKQRNWEAEMSDTAHQREVKDLIKAGLNPILSSTHGGASTPTGATASVPDFGQSVSSAVKNWQDRQVQKENINVLKQTAERERTQAQLNSANKVKTNAETSAIVAGLPKKRTIGSLWEKGEQASAKAQGYVQGEIQAWKDGKRKWVWQD